MIRTRALLLALGAVAAVPVAGIASAALAGQDVEMLGRHYGTPVPRAYYDRLAEDPDAFRFVRGRPLRLRQRMEAGAGARASGAALALGPRDGPVVGTFTIPVLLGLFADSPEAQAHDDADVSAAFFGAGGSTVRTYYEEVSGGRVSLRGDVRPWTRSAQTTHTGLWVTNGSSGLQARTPLWIKGLLSAAGEVDWGRYDNDGPDGVANSGDDDGFVDALGVMHPTAGAECRSSGADDRIWSHKWSLSAATNEPFPTTSPSANGGVIQVDDYFVVGVLSCEGAGLNEIGVFAHEAGHAFGLPDLYDTRPNGDRHHGAGNWSLMATGSWGCDNATPAFPCHMSAWSKMVLGWVDVVDVPAEADPGSITLTPVESGGAIYRVAAADGSGEYFLLENRQRIGFDLSLPSPGLLVWQIDPDWVEGRWAANRVNAATHQGVWLRQADGLDHLGRTTGGNRSDAGDPFPFQGNDAFHAASDPASVAFEGTATGVTLLDIRREGTDVSLRVRNRMSRITLRGQDAVGATVFNVDGVARPGSEHTFASAPFQVRTIEAVAGVLLEPGVRLGFREWVGAPDAPRIRTLVTPLGDSTLVSRYSGREVELALSVTGGVEGVTPGTFTSTPSSEDLWFPEGAEVLLEARPVTGFGFLGWTGALAGQPNPATVSMGAPRQAGAAFEVTYAVASVTSAVEAAAPQQIVLDVANANLPVTWLRAEGRLPEGLLLTPAGRIEGAALETGTFSLTVEARDALGLRDRGTVTLEVVDPVLSVGRLAAPFLLVGESITETQRAFLDAAGNDNGAYDLGDLRAWILAHPGLPTSAAVRARAAAAPTAPTAVGSGGGR